MNTKFKLLKKTAQVLLIALLLSAVGMKKVANAQTRDDELHQWELGQPFLFYLVYDDVQVRCSSLFIGLDAIGHMQLPNSMDGIGWWHHNGGSSGPIVVNEGWLCLAKNEWEGFQVFYREQDTCRNLIVEVDDFINYSQGDTLKHALYYEEYFYAEPYADFSAPDSLAEALVPYSGEEKVTQVGYNKVFYVDLHSRKDQSPGDYVSTVRIYDGEMLLASKPVTAHVWNFALPENHYAEVVMGLHNRNSGYNSTSSFLTLNGIQVDGNGNVAPEDLDEAKRILDGYQNCLLEHGVSTYEIPRWLMGDDPKAAELTMADPRRKVFTVPVLYGDLNDLGSDFESEAQQVLQQYKGIIYDNPFLKDKAFFYPYDEPENATDFAHIDQFCGVLSDYWPGYHATVPFYSEYYSTIEQFEGKIDILCPIKGFFDPGEDFSNATMAEQRLQDYLTRPHKWWYPDNAKTGGVDFFVFNTATTGVMRRILFWQQFVSHGDGLLYWNCAFLPNDWQKKRLPPAWAGGTVHGNGDGVLLYPATAFGQDADKPVVSLRLKQLSAGIDDYDYMRLVTEFLGEQTVWYYFNNRALNIGHYGFGFSGTLCSIMNKELEVFYSNNCHGTQISRWWYGRLLDQANIDHDWGEWQTAVLPDETHAGLEIRTCSHCGAQESREKTFLYRFVGTEDNQWANLNNWEGNPETLPAPGEAVVIAHDCEIDTITIVFNVIVNEGLNLTIHDGATLNSRMMTTKENAQVIIEDGAQLYTHSDGVQVMVKKNIASHGDADGWYFVCTSLASDVEPSTSNGMVSSTEDGYDLYYFDQSEILEWRNYKDNGFNLEKGKGYLYANQAETTLNFIGQLNPCDAEISLPIIYTNSPLAGLNLVGNPFACDAYLLNEDNEPMSFFKMNDTGDTLVAVQAGTVIKPCEGVFVICPNDRQTHSAVFTTTVPTSMGESQNVPDVLLPIHDLLVNQDASLTNDINQTTMLAEGTNWWSTNLNITLDDLKAALVAAMPNNNATITIKSKTQNVKYQNGRWAGSLTTFDITQLYKIIIPEACEISLEGVPVDPSALTVTITPGANWIAFPYSESMTVTDFFGSFPINNDVVKSKLQNTRYNNGRWAGQLNTLIPGQGYIYNSAATVDRVFIYGTNSSK